MSVVRHLAPLALTALAAGAALLCPRLASAGLPVVHVDASATGANNGTSWADAFTRLDVALAADPGAEFWVAEGVYVPPPAPVGDRRLTWFTVPAGTRIYGGFAGGESERDARDPLAHRTILSGDLDGDDTVDNAGITQDADAIVGSNAYHVVVFDATDPQVPVTAETRLDGVVVTAGRADGLGLPHTWGGGAMCTAGADVLACSPSIANVEFRGNFALERGGAWATHGDTATSSPRFENVLFRNNVSGDKGGAVSIDGLHGPRQVRMDDVRFEHNSASGGGAIFVNTLVDLTIDRAWFIGNRAEAQDEFFAQGGAIYNYGDYSGNAIVRVFNAVFQANFALGRGGVAFTKSDGGDATLELVNIAASGNSAGLGGVLFSTGGTTVVSRVRNSILWGNSATEDEYPGGDNVYGDYYGYQVPTGHRVEIAHSILEGGLAAPSVVYDEGNPFPSGFLGNGGGNLTANPQFVSGTNLRVRDGSPAIDAGNNAWNATDFDVSGLVRRFDGNRDGNVRIDIGAHEFGADGLFSDGFED